MNEELQLIRELKELVNTKAEYDYLIKEEEKLENDKM